MTIEEIVKHEGRQPDCSGYVTKYDIECSDGLTIRPGAFDDDNGKKVPMVWMHDHQNMDNVLGHIYLESRNDGVYGLGYFNDSPKGQLAKLYVDHGDISSFSIYANKLKKKAKDVVHGMIREVSLVLAGANRGAMIDSPISHSDKDEDEGEGVICMGDDYGGPIYGNDEPLSVEEYLEHYGRKGMKWGKNLFAQEYEAHPREKGEEEDTGDRKGPSEEKEKQVRKNAAEKKLNDNIVKLKEYEHNDRISVGGESANEIRDRVILQSHEVGKAIIEYMDAFELDDKERSLFLDQLQKKFDDEGLDYDVRKIDASGVMPSRKFSLDKNEEKAKEALPNTPGMNAKPEEKKEPKVSKEDKEEVPEQKTHTADDVITVRKVEKKEDKGPYTWKDLGDDLRKPIDALKDFARESRAKHIRIEDPVTSAEDRIAAGHGSKNFHVEDPINYPPIIREPRGKKIKEGLQKGLDELKDLGDKAASKGEEIVEKAEDILNDTKKKLKDLFKHSDLTDEEAEDIIRHYISGDITMDDILEHAENDDGVSVREVFDSMTDDQKSCVYYLLTRIRQAMNDGDLKHSEEEEEIMKHNVFDDAKETKETKETTLSHADMEKLEADVFKDAKSKGSLKDAFIAHADDYGIDNIEWLFPEDRNLNNPPAWIKRPDGWVSKVMKGVHHSPFSRIKSVFADITEADARARGYTKGNRKVEEVFGLLKRSTSPTTVYKKQKLDRDDIIDITDFDVVSWLKTEMRGMLDEELARAYLVGDGRSPASDDKINEQNIRPIWTDDDLFTIKRAIAVTSSTTTDEKCKQFIRACIKARKDYKGSGNPTLFTTDDVVSDLMLMEDQIGHPLYDSMEKLTAKLRVREIVTVPVLENLTRTSGAMTMELMGIIVNLDDYNVGADKGGAVSMFEDFDIDYNQEKYLIETRCSGALTKPYSAIVIETTSDLFLTVEPDDPSETRYSKSVSDLQSNVVVNDDSISGTLKYVTGYTGFSGDPEEQSGNYLALKIESTYGATVTVQMLNNNGSGNVVTMDDDYLVAHIRSKNAKLIVNTTVNGVTITKTYSMRLLKLEPKP